MKEDDRGKESRNEVSSRHASAESRIRERAEQRRARDTDAARDTTAGGRAESGAARREADNRKAADDAIRKWEDPMDPGHRETDAKADAAAQDYDGPARREFGPQFGQLEHERWSEEMRQRELQAGRVEGRDFGVEVRMRHPDGNPVYLDYVDYKTDTIVDRKAQGALETDTELARDYERQRTRHIEAYEHETGRKVFAYDYSPYPSAKDLYRKEQEDQ